MNSVRIRIDPNIAVSEKKFKKREREKDIFLSKRNRKEVRKTISVWGYKSETKKMESR